MADRSAARKPAHRSVWPDDGVARDAAPRRWLRDHARVAREATAEVSARFGTTFSVWLMSGLALALPAALYLLGDSLARVGADWEGRPGLTVLLALDRDDAAAEALAGELRARVAVAEVEVTGRADALAQFRARSGLADALALLPGNPLPASLRVVPALAELPALEGLAAELEARPDVDQVLLDRAWAERLAAWQGLAGSLLGVVAVVLSATVLLVTANSVRLAIERRLDEIRIERLVGASPGFIRRPFLYLGLWYGVGAGLVAAMVMSLALSWLEAPVGRLAALYGWPYGGVDIDPGLAGGLLLLGAVLGVGGALLALGQRLGQGDLS